MTAPVRMEVLEAREIFCFISFATFLFFVENKKEALFPRRSKLHSLRFRTSARKLRIVSLLLLSKSNPLTLGFDLVLEDRQSLDEAQRLFYLLPESLFRQVFPFPINDIRRRDALVLAGSGLGSLGGGEPPVLQLELQPLVAGHAVFFGVLLQL